MTKIGKKLAAVLLAVAMVVTFVPVLGTQTAYAESGDPAMNLGTEVLNKNVNTANPESVWYADTTWRVIGYDGTGAATVSGAATLLAANELDRTKFDTSSPYSNVYAGSALEEKVNGILNRFTPEERAAINARTLVHGSYNTESPWDTDCIAGDTDLENVFLWPLSAKEGTALNYNLRENSGDFWLRSPGKEDNRAFYIKDTGTGSTSTVDWNFAVRPAFHLNIGSVLLTSAAAGGKSSGTAGADSLMAVGSNATNEWKLTLHDSSRDGFTAAPADGAVLEMDAGYTDWSVSVVYSGASSANDNDYVSVILADSNDKVLYYGNIASKIVASSDAGQEVNIPAGLAAGSYKLYVFSEQINGDTLTDYASAFRTITLTVKPLAEASLAFSINKNYEWIDADDPAYVTSASINGESTRTAQINSGVKSTISVTPAEGYMVSSVSVNGSNSPWDIVQDFHSWTDQETGVHTITFIPPDGSSYAFRVALHEAVRVTFDLNGGTAGEGWLGNTRLMSKGSVVSSIGYEFEKIAPPEGKVLSAVEITTDSGTFTIAAADLNSTAHSYDSNVTFKCIWESDQPEPQPAEQTITASNIKKTYGNAPFSLNAKTNGDGTLTYKSSNTKVVTVDSAGKATIKGAGTAKITISASATANYKAASKTITVTVNKAANPLKMSPKTATVKYSKLKKKAQTLAVTKVIKFTKDAKDKKTYTLSSAKKGKKSFKKYFKINKSTGKVTVKKGLKKGTYKVKVKVKALGNNNYKASAVKAVTFTIKVK